MTPERLAELRQRNRIASVELGAVTRPELMDLLEAADNLNALLAAAEALRDDCCLSLEQRSSPDIYADFVAAIRRAKGE